MTQQVPGNSRLSRTAAKEVPHRSADRLFAAKSSAKRMCEDLVHDIRHSALHESMKNDLMHAVERVQRSLHDIAPDVDHASSRVKDLTKQIQHLMLAETWVSAAERVLTRLGVGGGKDVRDSVLAAQDTVMWCVRADHWDGQLTSAVTALESAVKEAEVHAARVAV